MSPLFFVLMMLFGGVGGNEALDYVDTESYWEIQGEELGVEELILEVKKPGAKDGAGAKAKDVRRLMAIRTLGEKKEKKALVVLKEMLASEEMFVADYAREAIGMIEGKKMDVKERVDVIESDLALLPKKTGVVGRVEMTGGPALDLKELIGEMAGAFGGEGDDGGAEMMMTMQTEVLKVIEQTGNLRIDSITVGVADNVANKSGWVMVSARGEYDRDAVMGAFKELGGLEAEAEKVEGVTIVSPEKGVNMAFVSNTHFVFLGGPKEEKMPLAEVLAGLKSKELRVSDDLKKLIGQTEKKGPLWISAMVTGKMKDVEMMKSFKTLQFESVREGGFLELLLVGMGEDGLKVQQALGNLEKMYKEEVMANLGMMKEGLGAEGKELVAAIEGLEFRGKGTTAIIRTKVKEVDPLKLLGSVMKMTMMGFKRQAEEFELEEDDL